MASLLLRDCCPSSKSCLAAFECGFRSNVVVHGIRVHMGREMGALEW